MSSDTRRYLMKFVSVFGTLEYKPADMTVVNTAVADWLQENAKPEPPLIDRKRDATLSAVRTTQSFKLFGKFYPSLDKEQKAAVDVEVARNLPQVPNHEDADYVKALKRWNDERFTVKFSAMIESAAIVPVDEEGKEAYNSTLAKVLTNKHEYARFYRAVVDVSEITWDAVQRHIAGMERYYKGDPFLYALERRGKTERGHVDADSWQIKARDIFARHGIIADMMRATVPAQCEMVAHLFTFDYIKSWEWEDRPKPVKVG